MLAWDSADYFGLAAMCNQPEDHRILGELCYHFSHLLGGAVAMDGDLCLVTADKNILNMEGVYEVSYDCGNERRCIYHVLTADAMSRWLAHPDFSMVK